MATLWFWLVAVMLALYVVLDGFDLGAGAMARFVARTPEERGTVMRAIGPVWDGNEVWLLAAGGALYFAFPPLYAASFSGFYLPLMLVLWMLIGRGISLEFRHHVEAPVWRRFWDTIFWVSSLLLTVFLGAALGNVVRGVPLGANGRFFLPLWTNFGIGGQLGILDWYTIIIGVASASALALHGSLWLAYKTEGPVAERAHRYAGWLSWAVVALTAAVTLASFAVQPHLGTRMLGAPWGFVLPALAVAGLGALLWFHRGGRPLAAFLASSTYLLGMLTSVVFGLYPLLLPVRGGAGPALTVETAAAPLYGLEVGLVWWIPGMILVAVYFVFAYRWFAGKVSLDEAGY